MKGLSLSLAKLIQNLDISLTDKSFDETHLFLKYAGLFTIIGTFMSER